MLKKQLEHSRLRHAIDYATQCTRGVKKLNSSELANVNQILTGTKDDPWRTESAQVKIPTGKVRSFSMLSNPIVQARDVISKGYELMSDGKEIEASVYVYVHLVMGHYFTDANRRTAGIAVFWLLCEYGRKLDVETLLKNQLGDLTDKSDIDKLRQQLHFLISS